MSEWIRWQGGDCPIQPGYRADIRFADGVEYENSDPSIFRWNALGGLSDIVAYRYSVESQSLEEAYEETERGIVDSVNESSALNAQVDGNHYKQFEIQPVEFINANKMDFLQGSVVKYVSRHKLKGKQKDVEKAIHFCKLILELQYAEGK